MGFIVFLIFLGKARHWKDTLFCRHSLFVRLFRELKETSVNLLPGGREGAYCDVDRGTDDEDRANR